MAGLFVDKMHKNVIMVKIWSIKMNLIDKKTRMLAQVNNLTFDKKGRQLQVLFIGNKFVELNNARKKPNSLCLNIRRMQKLVLLAEIYYMQIYKEALIEQDWEDYKEVNGLACTNLYTYNAFNTGEIKLTRNIWYSPFYKIPQEEYVAKIDTQLNEELNQIVEEIYNMTEYVDSVDLINMLRVNFPAGMSVPKYYSGMGGDFPIDKSIIYEKFQNFDFNQLRQLNEQEKQKYNIEM